MAFTGDDVLKLFRKLFTVLPAGFFCTLIFMMHGAIWPDIVKTRGPCGQGLSTAGMLWVNVAAMLIIFLILTLFYTNIYSNYLRMPWLVARCRFGAVFEGWPAFRACSMKTGRLWPGFPTHCLLCAQRFFGVMGIYPSYDYLLRRPKGRD